MAIVYLIPALYDTALGIVSFALPLFLLESRVDPVTMGSLLALPSLVQIFARVPAGLLSGRVGNINGMLLGCLLMLASGALIAGAPVGILVACVAGAQVLSGLARASFWPANQAFVLDMARERAAAIIGFYNFVVTLGGMPGPLLAGWLMIRGGYRWPFGLMAFLPGVSAALLLTRRWATPPAEPVPGEPAQVWRAPAEPTPAEPAPAKPAPGGPAPGGAAPPAETVWSRIRVVVRSPGVWLASLTCLISVIPFSVTASFLPVLLKTRGLSAASISLQVTVRSASVALFSLLSGPFVRVPYRAALLGVSALLGTAALFMIPVVAGGRLTVMPMLLFGLCGGAMHNVQMAAAGEAVSRQHRALAMAFVGSIGGVGMTLIPVVHGWMASLGWLEEAFPATGLVMGLIGVVAWRWCAALQKGLQAPGQAPAARSQQAAG
ncbi:MAG: MFS transporter [Bacillota bacterium]|nr:MFS transporter [Bacillota bacterium]